MSDDLRLVVQALRRSAKEQFYADHGDGLAHPVSDAIHLDIAMALERVAHDIEQSLWFGEPLK